MENEFYYPSRDGKTQIHAMEWVPEGEIKGVLQICHGMVEYIKRYRELGEYLAERGYYVTGHDHLGHGQSVQSEEWSANPCCIPPLQFPDTAGTMFPHLFPDTFVF